MVTNIDPEHLDHYGSFDSLKAAFHQFITQLPFYGFGVLCIDHPEVQALMAKVIDRRMVSYGTSPQADVRAVNIRQVSGAQMFDVEISNRTTGDVKTLKDVTLPMYGMHNVRNALNHAWEGWRVPSHLEDAARSYCRGVKIVVTGGFNRERIERFEKEGAPADIYGVGSSLLRNDSETNTDFTMDIVRLKLGAQWIEVAKAGRKPNDNPQLQKVDLSAL